jgi:hypothetical protein
MAQTTQQRSRKGFAPRPATDPQRWSRVSGGVLPKRARQPQKSTMQKALGMLPGMGAGKTAAKKGGGKAGSTAGGMAMLTAAAGLAYKNRGAIAGMLNRRKQPNAPA